MSCYLGEIRPYNLIAEDRSFVSGVYNWRMAGSVKSGVAITISCYNHYTIMSFHGLKILQLLRLLSPPKPSLDDPYMKEMFLLVHSRMLIPDCKISEILRLISTISIQPIPLVTFDTFTNTGIGNACFNDLQRYSSRLSYR